MGRDKRLKLKTWLLSSVLFFVVWLPRVLTPSPFVNADEPAWAYRSLHFLQGLLEGDLAQTFQTGHPGVLTMWAGAIGATVHQLERGEPLKAAVANLPVLAGGEFDPYDLILLRRVSPMLPAACIATATFDTLLLLMIFALLWRSFDRGTALLALGLLAFDPLHLALSRQLHPEALPALAMLLSLVAMLAFFKNGQRGMLMLSGVAAGLAVLDKTYALFLVPYAGLLMSWHVWSAQSKRGSWSLVHSSRRWVAALTLWGLVVVATIFVLWPALWVEPLSSVQEIVRLSTSFAQGRGTRTASFFLGQTVTDVGATFYPVVMFFLTTPLTTIGSLLALVTVFFAPGKRGERARLILPLLAFSLLFVAFLSLAGKKFPRYALAALLGLDVLAALGWRALYEMIRWPKRRWIFVVAAILQSGFVLSCHPYYLACYNPLAGGLRQATCILPVGGGEGTDLAAYYLAAKEDAASLRVATWSVPSLAPYFPGDLVPPTSPNWQTADYLLVYIGDTQAQTLPDVDFSSLELERTIQVHNVDYAWVYYNRYYEEPLQEIESRAKAEDTLFLDVPSVLTRYLPQAMQAHVLSGDEEESQVIARLSEISHRSQQVWLLVHPGSEMVRWLPWQLETHALLLNEWAFPGCQLTLYQLPPGTSFGPIRPVSLEASPPIQLDGNLALTALALTDESVEYRQELGVVSHWQAIAEKRPAYAISLRLVDETGYRWAQTDALLTASDGRNTAAWSSGEKVSTWHLLNIPAGIPPGAYRLVGVPYTASDVQAVKISDGAGQLLPTKVSLATVVVRSATLPPQQGELPVTSEVAGYEAELGDLKVLGYDLPSHELSVSPVPLVVCWQALRPPAEDYRATLRLQGPAEWMRVYPLAHRFYPTSSWQAGEVICTHFALPVSSEVPAGAYRLTINLADQQGQQVAAEGIPLTEVQVQQAEHTFEIPSVQHPLVRDFGEVARLLGYDLDSEVVTPATGVKLTLYWQAGNESTVPVNYTVFTHLLDPQGKIVAQHDSWPASGARPTTGWVKDEIIVDDHLLTFTAPDFQGTGQIEIGLYDQTSGERLPLATGSDHLVLPVRITVQN